jgi:hypothetical protein
LHAVTGGLGVAAGSQNFHTADQCGLLQVTFEGIESFESGAGLVEDFVGGGQIRGRLLWGGLSGGICWILSGCGHRWFFVGGNCWLESTEHGSDPAKQGHKQ